MNRLTKKSFLIACGSLLIIAAAYAAEEHIIHFAGPTSAKIGDPMSVSVQVDQAPMNVTFTSVPAGFVNYTTQVQSTNTVVTLPTISSASPGSYTVTAAPSGGGGTISRTVYASELGLELSSGNQ